MKQASVFYITGVRGIGKSHFIRLAKEMKKDTLFLPDMYAIKPEDMTEDCTARWYLNERVYREKIIRNNVNNFRLIICDRSYLCPLTYAYTKQSKLDFKSIEQQFQEINFTLGTHIYLKAPIQYIKNNLEKRHATIKPDAEDLAFLNDTETLVPIYNDAYMKIFAKYSIDPIIVNIPDTSNVDILTIIEESSRQFRR
jgi:thymidylate kinase